MGPLKVSSGPQGSLDLSENHRPGQMASRLSLSLSICKVDVVMGQTSEGGRGWTLTRQGRGELPVVRDQAVSLVIILI